MGAPTAVFYKTQFPKERCMFVKKKTMVGEKRRPLLPLMKRLNETEIGPIRKHNTIITNSERVVYDVIRDARKCHKKC